MHFPYSIHSVTFECPQGVKHGAVKVSAFVYFLIYYPFPSLECGLRAGRKLVHLVHCQICSGINNAQHREGPSGYLLNE